MNKLLDVLTECCREIKQKDMKARIKKTGEIAEIYGADVRVGENGSVTYYGADDLELIPDTPTEWHDRDIIDRIDEEL